MNKIQKIIKNFRILNKNILSLYNKSIIRRKIYNKYFFKFQIIILIILNHIIILFIFLDENIQKIKFFYKHHLLNY